LNEVVKNVCGTAQPGIPTVDAERTICGSRDKTMLFELWEWILEGLWVFFEGNGYFLIKLLRIIRQGIPIFVKIGRNGGISIHQILFDSGKRLSGCGHGDTQQEHKAYKRKNGWK
jgi:hypothetical protein